MMIASRNYQIDQSIRATAEKNERPVMQTHM